MLLHEHLLLALPNAIHISLGLLLHLSLVELFYLHVLLILHLLAELKILDELALSLLVLFNLTLHTRLLLLIPSNVFESLLLIFCSFFCAPVSKLILDFLALFHGHITSAL